MNSKRVFFVMIAALVVLVAATGGVAYLGNQMLTSHAQKLSDYKLQNDVLNSEKTSLAKAKKDVAAYQDLNTIAKSVVPQDKDPAEVVREITNIAGLSGITLSSITLPVSNLGLPAPAASSASGSTSSSPAASSKSLNLTQLTPVKGIKGVYVLELTIAEDPQSPIQYSQFIDFLSRLENNRRTSQVSNINLQPDSKDPNLISFTLTLDEYIKP